jgi:hypothetical protein
MWDHMGVGGQAQGARVNPFCPSVAQTAPRRACCARRVLDGAPPDEATGSAAHLRRAAG